MKTRRAWLETLRAVSRKPSFWRISLVALLYVFTIRYLLVTPLGHTAVLIIPPTGFILAAVLVRGLNWIPALLILSFAVRIWAGEDIGFASIFSAANVLVAAFAHLMLRRMKASSLLRDSRDTLIFNGAVTISAMISEALASVLLLSLEWTPARNFWTTWGNLATADIVSILAFTPLILLWHLADDPEHRKSSLDFRYFALLLMIGALSYLSFSMWPSEKTFWPFYVTLASWTLLFPLLISVVVRYPREFVAGAMFVFAFFCVLGAAVAGAHKFEGAISILNNAAVAIVCCTVMCLSSWLQWLKRRAHEKGLALAQEQRLRTIIEHQGAILSHLVDEIPVAIWFAAAPNFEEIGGNTTACNLLKIPEKDRRAATGSDVPQLFKYVCNGNNELVQQIPLRDVAVSGVTQSSEITVKHRDGSETHILGNVMPVRDSTSGEVKSCIAAYIDITERKRHEDAQAIVAKTTIQQLSESEQHYRELVELSPDAILLSNVEGQIVFTNRAALELFGARDDKELVGKSLFDVSHVDFHPTIRQRMKMLLEGQNVPPLEKKILRIDGAMRDVEVAARRYKDLDTPVIELVLRNITDRKQREEAFRESEARFRRIYESNSIGIAFSTVDGRLVDANQAFCNLTDYTPEDIRTGLRWHDIAIEPRAGRIFEDLKAIDTSGPLETKLRRKGAHPRPVIMSMAVLRGTMLQNFQIVTLVIDASETQKREETLRRSEEIFRSMIDNTADGIVTVDNSGIIVFINQRAQNIFGYSPRDLAGKPWSMLFADRSVDVFRRIRASDPDIKRRTAEILGKRKDGAEFPIEIALSSWNTATDSYTSANVRDITERKRAEDTSATFMTEERARRAEAEHAERRATFLSEASATLASSLDYVAALSDLARLAVPRFADTCTVYLLENNAIRRLATEHINPSKLTNLLELEKSYPTTLKDSLGPGAALRTGKMAWRAQMPDSLLVETARDEEHLKLLRKSSVKSYIITPMIARGRSVGVLEFAITENARQFGRTDVALAEDLAHRAAIAVDNASLYRETQQALFTAQKAIKSRDELIAIVSHDLKNPLNAIGIGASTALKSLDGISHSANKMNRLISDLLDIANIDARNLTIRRQPVDVSRIIEQACKMLEPQTLAKQLQLRCEVPRELPPIDADPARIEQVLSNLVGNSIKFTPAGGRINVRAERHGEDVCFIVSDTGPGIPSENLEHVFDRHWQAKETAHLGTGLGLSIAKGIVESHGGQIWVTSNPGEGSSFYFTVAIAKSESVPVDAELHGHIT